LTDVAKPIGDTLGQLVLLERRSFGGLSAACSADSVLARPRVEVPETDEQPGLQGNQREDLQRGREATD